MAIDKSALDEMIAKRVRPLLRVDGGTVEVVSTDSETDTVTLRFGGAYRGSPCRGVVLENVVKPILRKYVNDSIRIEMADDLFEARRESGAQNRLKET